MDELYIDNAGAIVVITPLGEKMALAHRVETVKPPLFVAHRSFRKTKPLSSRLDWRFYSHNSDHPISVNSPWHKISTGWF